MDISGKLFQIKKLLELQTFQKNDARDNLIKLLRDVYFTYMFYKVDDTSRTTKYKREQQSLLRLLLVHVDSENHRNNGEKILMINLINIIEKKIDRLLSYYPNIWKGTNSFFFFCIAVQYDDVQMAESSFNILKHSNSAYLNIYISLLLFYSNNFKTKIKTIKHIFLKYILNIENIDLSDKSQLAPNFEKFSITDFLKKAKSSKEIGQHTICCFFFSIIDGLIKNDYITLLNENKKREDEKLLRQVKWKENKNSKIGSEETKDGYLENIINYSIKKNIFNRYFNLNESVILNKSVDTYKCRGEIVNSDKNVYKEKEEKKEEKKEEEEDNAEDENAEDENVEDENVEDENVKDENVEDENEEDDDYIAEEDENGKKKKTILRKENLYYDTKKDEIIFNNIRDHYNFHFLKGLFYYVKRIIRNYELKYLKSKHNVVEIKKSYIVCCLIQCVSILFNICCFNQQLVPHSLQLIDEMKQKFSNYFDCSIIISLTQFILFFSSDKDFEHVANLMFEYFSEEYKNCIVSMSFFDFVIKNANILKEKDFFFRKFFCVILKAYFYYYRILKNALIYIFPYLMYEENYVILLCQLLDVPYLEKAKSELKQKEGRMVTICNAGNKYIFLTTEERLRESFSDNINYHQLNSELKNPNRLKDIRNNLHRYIKLYFDTLVTEGGNKEKDRESWIIEVTKIVIHKLKCITSYKNIPKKIVKEILKGFEKLINKKREILVLFQSEILHILNKNSEISNLINRKILNIIGDNIRYLKVPLKYIEQYYFTIIFFFTLSKFDDLKFWTTLFYALTNIAISCYDLSAKILEMYNSFLSQNHVPFILKHIAIENMSIITNFSYTYDV